jgi:hypothetical protein
MSTLGRQNYQDDGLGSPEGDAIAYALRQVPRVLNNRQVAAALLEDHAAAAASLGLARDVGPLLLNILNTVEVQRESTEDGEPSSSQLSERELRAILFEPFRHIRLTFFVLTAMSLLTFLVGMTLLAVAMVKAYGEQDFSAATLTIGGLGITDFVILFYGRPWDDIARGLSNSQQARMIAISYLSGLSMLQSEDATTQEQLLKQTRTAVELLEQFTEPRSGTSASQA